MHHNCIYREAFASQLSAQKQLHCNLIFVPRVLRAVGNLFWATLEDKIKNPDSCQESCYKRGKHPQAFQPDTRKNDSTTRTAGRLDHMVQKMPDGLLSYRSLSSMQSLIRRVTRCQITTAHTVVTQYAIAVRASRLLLFRRTNAGWSS